MKKIFALVDCNNFYASCEQVFQPRLEGKPVVVLSNNDGCIISRSNEAKHLGIPMGAAFFQWKKFLLANHVHIFSSNYELYGEMSQRVMKILEQFCPAIEIYSIDEAFLDLSMYSSKDLLQYAHEIKRSLKKWVGLPIAIGIAPTKTLAKIANHYAKKNTPTQIYYFCDPVLQEKILTRFPVEDIWGIGHRLATSLNKFNIITAQDLRDSNQKLLRSKFNVVMEKIINELRGISCLPLEKIQPKQQIMTSRSFGSLLKKIEEMEEAISHYAARASMKLRTQKSKASALYVFLYTRSFAGNKIKHVDSILIQFEYPSDDTSYIINKAKLGVKKIFVRGCCYYKAGLMLLDLLPKNLNQLDIFQGTIVQVKRDNLMQVMDQINLIFGKNAIQICAEGLEKKWQMKSQMRSLRCTTRMNELVKVLCE